jgi:hypothetical protein
MGWRIVKQPNGRLARFSDVVDDFTHMDLTEQEARDVCRANDCSVSEAAEKVRRGVADEPVPGFIEDDGEPLKRWREALRMVAVVHGYQRAADRERAGAHLCRACGGTGIRRPEEGAEAPESEVTT